MRKYTKITIIIVSVILILGLFSCLFLYIYHFDFSCLFKNCETPHSCITNSDCSDVWCPYKGPILGGGNPAVCYPDFDCIEEAYNINPNTNISEYCKDRKECNCLYE